MSGSSVGAIEHLADMLKILNGPDIIGATENTVRFWFRGQPAQFELVPGVYRPAFMGAQTFATETDEEAARRRRESHLFQDFRVSSAGLLAERADEVTLYFLQQHYRMPTRLLDWTQSPLTALYFAVSDPEDRDASWFLLDSRQFKRDADTREEYKSFGGIADARDRTIVAAVHVISWWQKPSAFPNFTFPTRPDHHDRRMVQQRSCFTFQVPAAPAITSSLNPTLQKFIIPASRKEHIRMELALLGVDEFSIYGDLEALARSLSERYK
jgi:hypothetical protein